MFASCSVDRTIKIWDTRKRGAAALSVEAHAVDVNVISWNRITPHLLVSGADDGSFSVWDLRNFKSCVARPRCARPRRRRRFCSLRAHDRRTGTPGRLGRPVIQE